MELGVKPPALLSRHQAFWKYVLGPQFIVFLLLVAIASTRQWLGTRDTQNYIDNFNGFNGFSGQFEPGFELLLWVVRLFDGNAIYFLFFCAIIGVGLKFIAINKYSTLVHLAIITYFAKYYFLHEMVQVRAGIAAGIFLVGIRYINEKKIVKFMITVAMAALFHYSALIYLLAYFVCDERIDNRLFVGWLVVAVLIVFSFNLDEYLINRVAEWLPQVALYQELLNYGEYARINFLNPDLLLREACIVLFVLIQKRMAPKIPMYDTWLKMMILSVFTFYLLRRLPVLAFRLSELMDVSMIFMFPGLVMVFKNRFTGFVVFVLVTSMTLFINFSTLQTFF